MANVENSFVLTLKTKAYHYFRAAADTHTDGDALFNAGYCLEHGMGIEKSAKEAAELYTVAATQFGHFDAVRALGSMHMLVKYSYYYTC